MQRLVAILPFLVLTIPLLVLPRSVGFDADRVASFFHNDSLPVSCNVHFGVDWYGGDMISDPFTDVDNPGECCAMCRDRLGCRAWLWRSDRDHCWLKDTIPRPILCPECIGGIFHHVVSSNPEVCNAQEESGWDGQNLEVRIGTTLGDCCDACNQSPNCTRWSFSTTTNQRCFLKRGNVQETNCTNCISGRNEENIRLHERRCNVVTGVDWFQNDINTEPYENATMSGCCEMCQNTTKCRAWLFRRRWRHCYLKDAIGSEQPCPDCIGGINVIILNALTAFHNTVVVSVESSTAFPTLRLETVNETNPTMAAFGGNVDEIGNQIFVTLRRGKNWPPITCDVRVKYEQTIGHIKSAVSEKLHVPKNQIQLFWHKKELTSDFDDKTLLDMNLHTGFSLRGYDLTEIPDYWPPVKQTPQGLVEINADA